MVVISRRLELYRRLIPVVSGILQETVVQSRGNWLNIPLITL